MPFLPPDGPPAALYRAAGFLPLPDRLRPLLPELAEGAFPPVIPPAEGEGTVPFLDAVEAILERLGDEAGRPVAEGAIDRSFSAEARVAAFLAALADPAGRLESAEILPPAALLLSLRRRPGAPCAPPGGERAGREVLPPSPFLDGRDWSGRGDPRLHAAIAWRKRVAALGAPLSAVPASPVT